LALRVPIGIYGGRREVEVGAQTMQQHSFLAHLLPAPCDTVPAILSPQILCNESPAFFPSSSFTRAARHRSCDSVTPNFVRRVRLCRGSPRTTFAIDILLNLHHALFHMRVRAFVRLSSMAFLLYQWRHMSGWERQIYWRHINE
jgi:hypothetical protein